MRSGCSKPFRCVTTCSLVRHLIPSEPHPPEYVRLPSFPFAASADPVQFLEPSHLQWPPQPCHLLFYERHRDPPPIELPYSSRQLPQPLPSQPHVAPLALLLLNLQRRVRVWQLSRPEQLLVFHFRPRAFSGRSLLLSAYWLRLVAFLLLQGSSRLLYVGCQLLRAAH